MTTENNCLSITKEELLNDFNVTFVEGAIYEDYEGKFWMASLTGNFWMADCYDLDENLLPLDNCPIPKRSEDFKRFVCFDYNIGEVA